MFLTVVASISAMIAPLPAQTAVADVPAQFLRRVDNNVQAALRRSGARGLALAYIDDGQVRLVRTWGHRNDKGDPLTPDTVMYGASLTKAVFGYTVMQLADEGKIDLDRSISAYLPKPLPSYGNLDAYGAWGDLEGDDRWRQITPKILLTHSAGFANFHWDEPGEKLRINFAPGSRYAYSGEGIILLQFALEQGLGLQLGQEMQKRVFDRFGMSKTGMKWRPDFAANLADGWKADGSIESHDERSRVRAAGSMDTTIRDFAGFAAGFMRGDGLSTASRRAMVAAHLPITTKAQFPSMQAELPASQRWPNLAAGLGVIAFVGPQGPGFFKGGHNDSTANIWVCLERKRRCVVILSNDVRSETGFPAIIDDLLGPTGLPWAWEYPALAAARR
jgi:CubicO group peptidase (beta-lactamase class C family)